MQTRHCPGDDPARIAIVTNAQGFVIADHLQLPILKAIAQNTLLLHATLKVCCFRSVCSRIARLSHLQQSSSHPSSHQPPHRSRHAQFPAVCISWSVICTKSTNYTLKRREISLYHETVVYLNTSRLCCLQLVQIFSIV
jgi:hypothetical protein